MTRFEILEHFVEESAPRPRVRGVIARELGRWRAKLTRQYEREALNKLVERLRRLAQPRWRPPVGAPTAASLESRRRMAAWNHERKNRP